MVEQKKNKEITFDMIPNNEGDGEGLKKPTFIPINQETEDFLLELKMIRQKEDEEIDENKQIKCTMEDFKGLFGENDMKTNIEINEDEIDDKINLKEELIKMGINLDDMEDIEEMSDDFVMQGFKDEFDDEFTYEKNNNFNKYEDIITKYDEMSSNDMENYKETIGSMYSASTVPRSEGLTNIDEHFESILNEYIDREEGETDYVFDLHMDKNLKLTKEKDKYKDISFENHNFQSIMNEFLNKTKFLYLEEEKKEEQFELIQKEIMERLLKEDEDEKDIDNFYKNLIKKKYTKKKKNTLEEDLENDRLSQISYSPTIISPCINKNKKKIVISKKTGIPKEIEIKNDKLDMYISDVKSNYTSALNARNKNETKEEKIQRKLAIKQYRQIRRCEKKANTQAFTKEKKKIQNDLITNHLSQGKHL